jgi:fumarate reductase flavoprotein subunit
LHAALAAGDAARGVSGNPVWGYLSGNGLLSAIAGGRIAAQTAIAQLQVQALARLAY